MLENRINSITIRNYRSLADVTVDLEDLTVLVGPNGSGKSNFLDALRFVRDVLSARLDWALHLHGDFLDVLSKTSSEQADIEFEMKLTLSGHEAEFRLVFGLDAEQKTVMKEQILRIGGTELKFDREDPTAVTWIVRSASLTPLDRFLTDLHIYSTLPNSILRNAQNLGPLRRLEEDGSNLASTLYAFLNDENNNFRKNLYEDFCNIVPGLNVVKPISVERLGNKLLVMVHHANGIGSLDLGSESDGTIRVLTLLTALYDPNWLSLIGIEEPELMIHPGALAYLADIIWATSHRSQVIISTHSPDLISRFAANSLRIVELVEGQTKIDPLREDQLDVINRKLFSGGDLLRIGGLARE